MWKTFLVKGNKNCRKPLFCRIFLSKVFLVKENFFDQVNSSFGKFSRLKKKFRCLWKISVIVEKFYECGKISWSRKISLTVEKLFDCWKTPWLWKNSLTVENVLDSGKILWLLKKSLTVEKFLDQGKHFWLWKTYILDCRKNNGSNILKANANIQTIKTNILSLSFHFPVSFAVDKINILTFTKT